MSIFGLMISIALICAAVLLVVYPLIRPSHRRGWSNRGMRQQADRVQAYYARVLTNIGDLDEDFSTGKISEADYCEEREVWVHRGIRLLRMQAQLDARRGRVDSADADAERIDRAIEDAIIAWRAGEAPPYGENAG